MAITPRKMLCPASKKSIKFPYPMNPTRIVIHNTYNDASANNEIAYMNSNNNQVSFHFAVDDKEVVQGIPLTCNAWHAGDGLNGAGNRQGIAIEICYSKSGGARFTKAEKLAAEFTAQLLRERGWGIERVTKHQDYSGKYCPHRTLDLGWQRFLSMVASYLKSQNENAKPKTYAFKVGEKVTISSGYKSSDAKLDEAIIFKKWKTGTIKRIAKGARNPYYVKNASGTTDCWCNAGDIREFG